ncbi:MAG: DUF1761 domain-containing protein [Pseudomonadota bacterium]
MGILAILLAAAGGFATGAVWYMVLAKPWMNAVGISEEDVKASQNPITFIIAFLAALLTAAMMRHVFMMSGIDGLVSGLLTGLGIGAFMTAPWILTNYAFSDRPKALWAIDGGYATAACTVIGAILGIFGT